MNVHDAHLGMFGTPVPRAMLILIIYFTQLYLNQCINISTLKGAGKGLLNAVFARSDRAKHVLSTIIFARIVALMDDSSYRRNFDLDKKNELHYHSWKEHLKISKIAKFGCELLYNEENIAL